jgi:hypothetical protein
MWSNGGTTMDWMKAFDCILMMMVPISVASINDSEIKPSLN